MRGLAGHYALLQPLGQQIQECGWRKSGLDWIGQRNRDFSKPVLMWDTAAQWLLAYRSPRPPIDPPKRVIRPVVVVSSHPRRAPARRHVAVAAAFARRRSRRNAPTQPGAVAACTWMAVWLLAARDRLLPRLIPPPGRDVWNARYLAVVWPR